MVAAPRHVERVRFTRVGQPLPGDADFIAGQTSFGETVAA
jgi:hypothetical protein